MSQRRNNPRMLEHHKKVIEGLVEEFGEDARFPALIVTGSVAKGRATREADVDVHFVATDEEFERRRAKREYSYIIKDACEVPEVYVDGKVVDLGFLKDCAERGSEPARYAFVDAFVAYSRIPELEEILSRIPVYQEEERAEKMRGFFAQVKYLMWLIPEAEKRGDRYTPARAAADLVLFGGRLILAHNRMLYPYHKWFTYELGRAPEKPEGLIELAEKLLERPSKATAKAFGESVVNFTEWEKPEEGWVSWFMENEEWNWRKGKPPLQDW